MTEKKRKRGKPARRRHMLETPELRWKAGREPMKATVKGHPLNRQLVETDLGLVAVRDSTLFAPGLEFPVWVEQGSGRLIAKGQPRQRHRW